MAFDIQQSIFGRSGEPDEKTARKYKEQLVRLFAESPEGKALKEKSIEAGRWADISTDFGISYLGVTPPRMSPVRLREILFELFPRKLSILPEAAPEIIEELQAFWQFLQREFGLANATDILKVLDAKAAQRLERELGNPANFGIAKSMVMMGMERGFDLSTEEGLEKWMNTYNAELLTGGPHIPLPGEQSINARKTRGNIKRAMARSSRRQNRKKQ